MKIHNMTDWVGRYKAILFDFDYTLVDSSNGVCECVAYSLSKTGYGIPSDEEICKTIGLPLPGIFATLTSDDDPDAFEKFRVIFKEKADEVMNNKTIFFDKAPETIRSLCNQLIRCGIVSTKFRYRIAEVLERYDLTDNFEVVIGGEDVSAFKPDPEGLIKAIRTLDLSKDDCVFVGDSVIDAQTAQNAGVDFIGVLSGTTSREQLDVYPNICLLGRLSELVYSIV